MENVTITHLTSLTPHYTFPNRQRWLQVYEQMVCITCGEPLKCHIAHYPRQQHIHCLISTRKASELITR
jgi:hypothetical protein